MDKFSKKAATFYPGIIGLIQEARRKTVAILKEADIIADSGRRIQLRELDSTGGDPNSRQFARLQGMGVPDVGDHLLVVQLEDGEYIVVGKIVNPDDNENLLLRTNHSSALRVEELNGTLVFNVDSEGESAITLGPPALGYFQYRQSDGFLRMHNAGSFRWYDAADANIKGTIDATGIALTNGSTYEESGRNILTSGKSTVFDLSGSNGTDTNSDTEAYVAGGTRTFSTPAYGTWEAWLGVITAAKHSVTGTGQVTIRPMITSQTGGASTLTTGDVWTNMQTWTVRSGIPASTSVSYWIDFKPANAGTATLASKLLIVHLHRTG